MEDLIKSSLVTNTCRNLFGNKKTEIIERQASYVIKLKDEPQDKVTRIILLPPKGFTANKIDEASSHPEARRATITIKGGVKPNKDGFNIIKNVLKFQYYSTRDVEVIDTYPYATMDKTNPSFREEFKSSREKFYVVKESGEGFYHNLINLSDEWLLLILEKELCLKKKMDIKSKILLLSEQNQQRMENFIGKVQTIGDRVYEHGEQMQEVLMLGVEEAVPILIEALNMHETGKHEPCSIYALILKFAKKEPENVIELLKRALKTDGAPKYYLTELIAKVSRFIAT